MKRLREEQLLVLSNNSKRLHSVYDVKLASTPRPIYSNYNNDNKCVFPLISNNSVFGFPFKGIETNFSYDKENEEPFYWSAQTFKDRIVIYKVYSDGSSYEETEIEFPRCIIRSLPIYNNGVWNFIKQKHDEFFFVQYNHKKNTTDTIRITWAFNSVKINNDHYILENIISIKHGNIVLVFMGNNECFFINIKRKKLHFRGVNGILKLIRSKSKFYLIILPKHTQTTDSTFNIQYLVINGTDIEEKTKSYGCLYDQAVIIIHDVVLTNERANIIYTYDVGSTEFLSTATIFPNIKCNHNDEILFIPHHEINQVE